MEKKSRFKIRDEKTHKISNTIRWFDKFDNSDLRLITTDGTHIDFNIRTTAIPHLMGLHYMSNDKLSGQQLLGIATRKSDNEIYKKIEENVKLDVINVYNRVCCLKPFLQNLENASLVKFPLSKNSKMSFDKSIALINKGCIQVLGLGHDEERNVDYVNTFLPNRRSANYRDVDMSNRIEKIQIYDRNFNEYRDFSFDDKRRKKLDKEFIENKFKEFTEYEFERLIDVDYLLINKDNVTFTISEMFEDILKKYAEKNHFMNKNIYDTLNSYVFDLVNEDNQFTYTHGSYDVGEISEKDYVITGVEKEHNNDIEIQF